MKKFILTLLSSCTISISLCQNTDSEFYNTEEYVVQAQGSEEIKIARTDIEGNVVWIDYLSNMIESVSEGLQIAAKPTIISNGKIRGNPNDYDYWVIDQNTDKQISVYPTLCTDHVNLYVYSNNPLIHCTIYNVIKQESRVYNINYGYNILDLIGLSDGLYIVSVNIKEDIIPYTNQFKIIKTK